jgi:hypothetical protein
MASGSCGADGKCEHRSDRYRVACHRRNPFSLCRLLRWRAIRRCNRAIEELLTAAMRFSLVVEQSLRKTILLQPVVELKRSEGV